MRLQKLLDIERLGFIRESTISDRYCADCRYNRFFAKALPDGDFRYFSKAKACFSSEKATYVFTTHGAYFDV